MAREEHFDCLVIGAGISGLDAAYHIQKHARWGLCLSRGAQYSTPMLDTFHLLICLLQLGHLPNPREAKQPRWHVGLLQVSGNQVGQRHVHLRLLLEDLEVG